MAFHTKMQGLLDDFASVSATARLYKLSALEKALSTKFMKLEQVNQRIMINAKLQRGELTEIDRNLDKVPSNYGALNALKTFPNIQVWHMNVKIPPCVLTGHEIAKNVMSVMTGLSPSEGNAAAIWRTCLFYGPPGVGKTLALRILYENCPQPWRCFWLDVEELRRCQDNLTELVFFSAVCHSPAIIILDNIDRLCSTDRAVNVCGIVIIVCGAVSLHFMKGTGPLIGENYVSAPIALIVIGVAVFLLAFLGCCGASQESYCMLTMFSTLLFLLLCAEITVGVLAFVYRGKAKEITEQQLRASMKDYYKKIEVNPTKQAWDFVQEKLECCGVTSSIDWTSVGNIPPSCGNNPVHLKGCLDTLVAKVEQFSVYVGVAGFVIGAIELIGICFACCLANGVRS